MNHAGGIESLMRSCYPIQLSALMCIFNRVSKTPNQLYRHAAELNYANCPDSGSIQRAGFIVQRNNDMCWIYALSLSSFAT